MMRLPNSFLKYIKITNQSSNESVDITENSPIEKKIEYLKERENTGIREYLSQKTNNIFIEDDYYGKIRIMELITKPARWEKQITPLSSWCGLVAILLGYAIEDAYIERGKIRLSSSSIYDADYYHCWTCFPYQNEIYIADPCNNIIATKSDYYKLFIPKILGRVSAEDIKNKLIKEMSYNVYYQNTEYKIVRREYKESSPLINCFAIFKEEGDELIVKIIDFIILPYSTIYEKALEEFTIKESDEKAINISPYLTLTKSKNNN